MNLRLRADTLSKSDQQRTAEARHPCALEMHRPTLEDRFAYVQRTLARLSDASLLDSLLSTWVLSSDRHLPKKFLARPLRKILDLTYDQIADTRGMGDRRIGKLLDVLERVASQATVRRLPFDGRGVASVEPVAPDDLTEPVWQEWCEAIRAHRIERENLGKFVSSLSDLPQGLWSIPLSEYTGRRLSEVRTMARHGPTRVGLVLDVFSRIAQTIAACPADAPLAIRLLPLQVRDVVLWAEHVLHERCGPSVQEIRERFLTPLFELLEADMGPEAAAIVGRRIGLDGPAETLEQIASDVGLTRERVRQISLKAVNVTRARWPEGRYLLDNIYAQLLLLPGCDQQIGIMHSVLDACFALEVIRGGSRAQVLAAWDRTGRAKRTPMTEAGVRSWAAEEFPDQPADVIRRWLEEEGLRHSHPLGEDLFFSNDPLDTLLLHLLTHPEPISVGELTDFVDGDERNIRNRIDRDPRFIEDEFKRVLPAEQCSFVRRNGQWFIQLDALQDTKIERRESSIAVAELVSLIVGGLVQAGICDATVWGVHRFALLQVRRVYGATLAPVMTPFLLASTLVRYSNGLVRPMRRRRLRWDSADRSIPVRGKRGWVDHIASAAGVPMTLDELDTSLRDRFQDYESYVLKQLNQYEDEDGEASAGFQFVPGVSHVIPPVIIPRGWELDLVAQNISEGVRLAVAKLVAMSTEAPVSKQYLRRLPWMVRLCDHAAFGGMRWEDRVVALDDDGSDGEPMPKAVGQKAAVEIPSQPSPDGSAAVDDLLSRIF